MATFGVYLGSDPVPAFTGDDAAATAIDIQDPNGTSVASITPAGVLTAASASIATATVTTADVVTVVATGHIRSSVTATAVLADAGTIATTHDVAGVAPAADVTGVILAPGTVAGQRVAVFVTTAHSVTFDAAGTSNVADGVSSVIAALTAALFVWDTVTALWYRIP